MTSIINLSLTSDLCYKYTNFNMSHDTINQKWPALFWDLPIEKENYSWTHSDIYNIATTQSYNNNATLSTSTAAAIFIEDSRQ